jgi:uncharacterized membrane-anchored protein
VSDMKHPNPISVPDLRPLPQPTSAQLVAIPARDAYTYVAGKPVTLQTAPVDPYDLLRGYYQTLRYDISDAALLRSLPGGDRLTAAPETSLPFYVILEAPAATATTPPPPWKPVRISLNRPTELAANQAAIQGQFNSGQITYGLETYYMPEDQRQQINADIGQVQQQNQEEFVVEVKVDAGGNAVPLSLWVRDRNYRF